MAGYLQSSGAISMSEINSVFDSRGQNLNAYRGTTWYTAAGGSGTFSSGALSFSDFYNKGPSASRTSVSYTFSSSTANASLNVAAIGGYVAGSTDVTITVNSGVYLYSTAAGTSGLTLTGGTTGDTITLVNNGFIMGRGGDGAIWDSSGSLLTAATAGSTALSLGFNTTVTNTSGYIGGGGGSGGGIQTATGPGGAGGGVGGTYQTVSTGGTGGGIGASGGNGSASGTSAGGGGGRILPGTGGAGGTAASASTSTSGSGGGAGGGGGANWISTKGGGFSNAAGGGGGWGASGGSYYDSPSTGAAASGGAGGSAGAAGANGTGSGGSLTIAGTAGGKAVALNGRTITWTGGSSSSSRAYGAVS